MILGTSILGISFLLMGPCRYILRKPNDVATMFGVIILGIGFALAYVPTLDFLVDTAIYDLGYFKHPATYGPISGLWNFLNGFGETFGPVIAMFQNSPDIRDATLVFSTVLFTCVGSLRVLFHSSFILVLSTAETKSTFAYINACCIQPLSAVLISAPMIGIL